MAGKKVVLYFDRQEDALHFTLAAGSVLSSEKGNFATDKAMSVIQEIGRANRINFHTDDEADIPA
jgi:hypothetical protein